MPDLMTTFKFALECGGVQLVTFQKCEGFGTETEIIEFKEATPDGKQIIRKVPGLPKWTDLKVTRRVDSNKELWKWRKMVVDGNIDEARRDCSIVIKDSMDTEVARWNITAAWPSNWEGPGLDAAGNEIAVEVCTITHEGLTQG